MKKFSFLSGLTAFALLFSPLGSSALATGLEEEGLVTEAVNEAVYEEVTEAVYEEGYEEVIEVVYEEGYEEVTEVVYEEGYEEVIEVVYEEYEEVIEVVYEEYEEVIEVVYEEYEEVIEVVYEEVYEEEVTEVVYVDAPYLPGNLTEDVAFNYSDLSNENLELIFDSTGLSEEAKGNNVTINKGNIKVTLPLSLFAGEKVYSVGIYNLAFDGALGTVYDFKIEAEDGTVIHDFKNTPVTLTFKVDPAKVSNWDNVKVIFIDENGVKTSEVITPISVDKNTGIVVAKVTHFSTYGVFEVASATTGSTPGSTGTGGTTTTGTTTNNSTKTTGTTSTVAAGTTNNSTVTAAATKTIGNELPNTATNAYNMLLVGLLTVALGGMLLIVKLRREMKTN